MTQSWPRSTFGTSTPRRSGSVLCRGPAAHHRHIPSRPLSVRGKPPPLSQRWTRGQWPKVAPGLVAETCKLSRLYCPLGFDSHRSHMSTAGMVSCQCQPQFGSHSSALRSTVCTARLQTDSRCHICRTAMLAWHSLGRRGAAVLLRNSSSFGQAKKVDLGVIGDVKDSIRRSIGT